MEKVHSQTLAWIFSDDCKAIEPEGKILIINDIFNLNFEDMKVIPKTEYKSIDIVLEIGDAKIVIENKIKTGLHNNQLQTYEEKILKELKPDKGYFYYLTLYKTLEKLPNEKVHWYSITYKDILEAFKKHDKLLIKSKADTTILRQYLLTLDNIYRVSDKFIQSQELTDNENNYIKKLKMRTFLQKQFLMNAVKVINDQYPRNWIVDETHGNGQIGCCFIDCDVNSKIKYHVAYQSNSLKIWFEGASSEYVEKAFEKANNYDYKRINKTRNKSKENSYISISKTIVDDLWNPGLNYEQFAKLFINELKRVEEIINKLKKDSQDN